MVPTGRIGDAFVSKLSCFFGAYEEFITLDSVALTQHCHDCAGTSATTSICTFQNKGLHSVPQKLLAFVERWQHQPTTVRRQVHPVSEFTAPGLLCPTQKEKKRAHEQRVNEIKHGLSTPLVFSTSEGTGTAAILSYMRLASKLADKRNEPYSLCIQWLRCLLNFSWLRSPSCA